MGTLGMPSAVEELTPAWLTAALRQTGTIRRVAVTTLDHEVLSEGRWFTGRVSRLRLGYDGYEDGAPAAAVAKLPSTDPCIRAELNSLGVYEREFRFYTEIRGAGDLPVPRLYYAGLDQDTGRSILLLEDLEQARVGDNLRGCSDEDAYLAVAHLAGCQAAWWENSRLMSMSWLTPLDPHRLQQLWQRLWGKFGSVLPDPLRDLARRLVGNIADYRCRLDARPRTLLHGDFRLDNLLFGAPGRARPLTIIDWQLTGRGCGVADLAYFAAFCLSKEQRRAIERRLVETYHAALVAKGISGYSLDWCWDNYRFHTLGALGRIITAGALLDLSSTRGRALTLAIVDRVNTMLVDHQVDKLLPATRTDQ
jgi:hypothetical protein